MHILKNIFAALSMFSRLHMPQFEYSKENTQYILGFFPFVGFSIGAILWIWVKFSIWLDFSNIAVACGMCIIPPIVTGFIHLDGFMDCCDAMGSNGNKEKMLMIMKDSNVGAFAVINILIYFLIYFSLCCEIKKDDISLLIFCSSFIISRCLSGILSLKMPKARNDGMVKSFCDNASEKTTLFMLYMFLALSFFFSLYLSLKTAIVLILSAILCLFYCRKVIKNKFGGITGDLSGWFLCLNELLMLGAVVISQKI